MAETKTKKRTIEDLKKQISGLSIQMTDQHLDVLDTDYRISEALRELEDKTTRRIDRLRERQEAVENELMPKEGDLKIMQTQYKSICLWACYEWTGRDWEYKHRTGITRTKRGMKRRVKREFGKIGLSQVVN